MILESILVKENARFSNCSLSAISEASFLSYGILYYNDQIVEEDL